MTVTTGRQDFIPMGGSLFKIPSSSNLRWLIMFYALPRELVEKRPAFLAIPRKVREVVHSEKWMRMVNFDMFLELVWDCYAWVSWQFFKVPAPHGGYMPVPGSFYLYSGNFPLWRYAYITVAHIRERLDKMPNFCFQRLFSMGKDYEVPWMPYENFYDFFGQMTTEIVAEQHWQEAFDMLWEHRAPEDYNGSSTKQQDFERSWYHSRSLEKELSLEQIRGNDAELPVNAMCHAAVQSFEEQLLDEEQIKQFMQTLPDTDRKIILLRMQNDTLAEIAQKLNFANAGSVSKHLAKIRKQLEIYRKK